MVEILLSSDDLQVHSENTVRRALTLWLRVFDLTRKLSVSLAQCVRYPLMTAGYLLGVVKYDSFFVDNEVQMLKILKNFWFFERRVWWEKYLKLKHTSNLYAIERKNIRNIDQRKSGLDIWSIEKQIFFTRKLMTIVKSQAIVGRLFAAQKSEDSYRKCGPSPRGTEVPQSTLSSTSIRMSEILGSSYFLITVNSIAWAFTIVLSHHPVLPYLAHNQMNEILGSSYFLITVNSRTFVLPSSTRRRKT